MADTEPDADRFWTTRRLLAAAACLLLALGLIQLIAFAQLRSAAARLAEQDQQLVKLGEQSDALKRELAAANVRLEANLRAPKPTTDLVLSYLAQAPKQELAVQALRAVYVPEGATALASADLAALMDLVQGATLFSAGYYDPAARLFRQASDQFVNRQLKVLSLFALGTAQKCAAQHDAAVRTYDRILKMVSAAGGPRTTDEPQERSDEDIAWHAMAMHFKGWSYYCLAEKESKEKRYEEVVKRLAAAKRCYEEALLAVPSYAKVRLNGWVLHSFWAKLDAAQGEDPTPHERAATQQLTLSVDLLRARVAEYPEDAKSHFTLALMYAVQAHDEAALSSLKEAIRLDASLAFLLRSESAFKRLSNSPVYQELVKQAEQFQDRFLLASLFTDADFPQMPKPRAAPPGTSSPSRTPETSGPSRTPETRESGEHGRGKR